MESELTSKLELAENYIQQLMEEKNHIERQYENDRIESPSLLNQITEEKNELLQQVIRAEAYISELKESQSVEGDNSRLKESVES